MTPQPLPKGPRAPRWVTQHREAGQPDSWRLVDTGPSLTLMWETR